MWTIAWPTVLQNAIGGLQGIIDHAMVGHFVGYTANAAIGVSWQIFLVVIVFITSLFTGMGVLVARAAGANDHERVDRVVYQAFLVAVLLSVGVMAPLGYVLAPHLLRLVNATPEVSAQALPFMRTMFLFSIGMLLFFMLGGALRAAGDAKTPLRLGVIMTVLNIVLNVILISGAGPIPAMGTRGSALGDGDCQQHRVGGGAVDDVDGTAGRSLPPRHVVETRFLDHPAAVPLRAPRWTAGSCHEHRGRPAAAVHRVSRAQC